MHPETREADLGNRRQRIPTRTRKGRLFAGILLTAMGLSLFMPGLARAFSLTLAWDPNTETDLTGYKIYIGYAPQKYSWIVDVGNRTNGTIADLVAGTTYYFTLTAYNSKGHESGFSNEIRFPILTYDKKIYLPLVLQGPR
jgi:hypothetical protein